MAARNMPTMAQLDDEFRLKLDSISTQFGNQTLVDGIPSQRGQPSGAPLARAPSNIDIDARDAATHIQLRLMEQKLRSDRQASEEDEEAYTELGSTDSDQDLLQEALLKRQHLERTIAEEKLRLLELSRAPPRRERTPSPPRRRRSPSPMSPPTPKRQQPPPQPVSNEHIVKHVYTGMPPQQPQMMMPQQPMPAQNRGSDMMEMMMMQSYQMSQMLMQQAMLSNIQPKNQPPPPQEAPRKPEIIQVVNPRREQGHSHGQGCMQMPMMMPNMMMPNMMMPNMMGNMMPQQPMMQQMPQQQVPRSAHRSNVQPRVPAGYSAEMARPQPSKPSGHGMEGDMLLVPKERHSKKVRVVNAELMVNEFMKKNPIARNVREIFYLSWFLGFLRVYMKRNHLNFPLDVIQGENSLLFELAIKEVAASIIRIYKDFRNPLRRVMNTLVLSDDTHDLSLSFSGNRAALHNTCELMKELCYYMQNDIPETGILGTHRKSGLYEMIAKEHLYPTGFLWDIEEKALQFDHSGRTGKLNTKQQQLIIILMFMGRGLIRAVMLDPVQYNITDVEPDPISRENMKLMASLLTYIYRGLFVDEKSQEAGRIPPCPAFLRPRVIEDNRLRPILDDPEIQTSIDYCDKLVRNWSYAYIRRLNMAKAPPIS